MTCMQSTLNLKMQLFWTFMSLWDDQTRSQYLTSYEASAKTTLESIGLRSLQFESRANIPQYSPQQVRSASLL